MRKLRLSTPNRRDRMAKGQQTIHCDVSSCQHFDQSQFCKLSAIQVTPCTHVNNGVPEDETLCASYEMRS